MAVVAVVTMTRMTMMMMMTTTIVLRTVIMIILAGHLTFTDQVDAHVHKNAVFVARDYIQQRLGLLPNVTLDIIVSEGPSAIDGFSNIQHGESATCRVRRHPKLPAVN